MVVVLWPPNKAQSTLLRMLAKLLLSTPLSKIFFDNSVSVAASFSRANNLSLRFIHSSSNSCLRVCIAK